MGHLSVGQVKGICSIDIGLYLWDQDQGQEWTILMITLESLKATGSISFKAELEDFYVFFCFFFFCNLILSFRSWLPGLKTNFYFYVVVFWNSSIFFFFLSGFLIVCQCGLCSTVTVLRYCGRLRETDIKLSYYYCTFGRKIQWNSRFEINKQENNLIKTDFRKSPTQGSYLSNGRNVVNLHETGYVFQFYFLHQNNLPGNHSLCLSK